MKIVIQKKPSKKFKDFFDKEWDIADVDHYGRPSNWDTKDFTIVAKEKNEIMGMISFKIEVGVAWIRHIIVAHSKQGKGIGKQLMKKMEDIAKEHDAHKTHFVTGKGWKAVEFYKLLGYEITTDLPKHYLQHDFVMMTKFI